MPLLIEHYAIQDTYITNIGEIHVLDSCARFVLYVDQQVCGSQEIERVVVQKIVIPIQNVPSAIAFTVAQLGGHWLSKPVLPQFLMPVH